MIFLASDHAGFHLKEKIRDFLKEADYQFKDLGPPRYQPDDDYPKFAKRLAQNVSTENATGIWICGSGHGGVIVCNKYPGIRATLIWNELSAKFAKAHNHANIICLPARLIGPSLAISSVKTWLKEEKSPSRRHIRRLLQIEELEVD